MQDDTLTVGIDPRFLARIADLVEQGEYGSVDEFMNEAVRLRLEQDPLEAFFESPRGRELLRQLVREERDGTPAA